MRLALDSNRYSDLHRIRAVADFLEMVEEIHVPLPVVAELRAGFAHGTKRGENERSLALFLNKPAVYLLQPDYETTSTYADLYAYLRQKGRMIPINDLWIAALAVQHKLPLFDRDAHFDNLPQLVRVKLPPG